MNTETGKVYTTPKAIEAAQARGEKLTEVSARAAKSIKAGRAARARTLWAQRAARQRKEKHRNRKRDAIAKASRKRNR